MPDSNLARLSVKREHNRCAMMPSPQDWNLKAGKSSNRFFFEQDFNHQSDGDNEKSNESFVVAMEAAFQSSSKSSFT